MAERFLDVFQVECILEIGKNKVYDYLRSGELKGFKLGRVWRVSERALEEFLIEKRIETKEYVKTLKNSAQNVHYPNEFKATKE